MSVSKATLNALVNFNFISKKKRKKMVSLANQNEICDRCWGLNVADKALL